MLSNTDPRSYTWVDDVDSDEDAEPASASTARPKLKKDLFDWIHKRFLASFNGGDDVKLYPG